MTRQWPVLRSGLTTQKPSLIKILESNEFSKYQQPPVIKNAPNQLEPNLNDFLEHITLQMIKFMGQSIEQVLNIIESIYQKPNVISNLNNRSNKPILTQLADSLKVKTGNDTL